MRSASRVLSSGPTRTAKRCSKSASMNAAWPAHSAWPSRGLESSHAGPLGRKTANRRSISPTLSPHIVMRNPPSQLLDAPGSAKRFCLSAAALLSRRLQPAVVGRPFRLRRASYATPRATRYHVSRIPTDHDPLCGTAPPSARRDSPSSAPCPCSTAAHRPCECSLPQTRS